MPTSAEKPNARTTASGAAAAGQAEDHRLDQELQQHIAPFGAERLPQTDFLRPLVRTRA